MLYTNICLWERGVTHYQGYIMLAAGHSVALAREDGVFVMQNRV
jgi:hypothetical protein